MYEHLTGEGDGWGMVTEDFRHLLRGEMLAHRTVLNNQSNIQILTASSKSVRGAHPQKIKLDEVDEMDPNIYEAALLVPQTKRGIKASVQIIQHHASDLRLDGPGHKRGGPERLQGL